MQKIKYTILYCVLTRSFVIPFYNGPGTVIDYGSGFDFLTNYGSGSTRQKVTVPSVPVPQHCCFLTQKGTEILLVSSLPYPLFEVSEMLGCGYTSHCVSFVTQ
jgi:hypothetical protein